MRKLRGRVVPKECYERFLDLKNAHLKDKEPEEPEELSLDQEAWSHLNAIADERDHGNRGITYGRKL